MRDLGNGSEEGSQAGLERAEGVEGVEGVGEDRGEGGEQVAFLHRGAVVGVISARTRGGVEDVGGNARHGPARRELGGEATVGETRRPGDEDEEKENSEKEANMIAVSFLRTARRILTIEMDQVY